MPQNATCIDLHYIYIYIHSGDTFYPKQLKSDANPVQSDPSTVQVPCTENLNSVSSTGFLSLTSGLERISDFYLLFFAIIFIST